MERITYVLGAGFSAPLGLPVMRDFLTKSKDLYFSDTTRYKHFEQVFTLIHDLSVAKNYFEVDLFNIEEILSILEMQVFVEKRRLGRAFSKYVCDVIVHYTPPVVSRAGGLPGNWHDFVFGGSALQRQFGHFAGNILGLNFEYINDERHGERRFLVQIADERDFMYSIITLNYDMVLENFADFVQENYETNRAVGFGKQIAGVPEDGRPALAKLHGSVDSGAIVPPTWAKGTHRKIAPVWKKAFELIERSNQIRFIGYSLPANDAYIKYLLKASIVGAQNLKKIDVICLDPYGDVRQRYERFIRFNLLRFRDAATQDYLKAVPELSDPARPERRVRESLYKINGLEKAHEQFMGG